MGAASRAAGAIGGVFAPSTLGIHLKQLTSPLPARMEGGAVYAPANLDLQPEIMSVQKTPQSSAEQKPWVS